MIFIAPLMQRSKALEAYAWILFNWLPNDLAPSTISTWEALADKAIESINGIDNAMIKSVWKMFESPSEFLNERSENSCFEKDSNCLRRLSNQSFDYQTFLDFELLTRIDTDDLSLDHCASLNMEW